jgi:hypothetical protein
MGSLQLAEQTPGRELRSHVEAAVKNNQKNRNQECDRRAILDLIPSQTCLSLVQVRWGAGSIEVAATAR